MEHTKARIEVDAFKLSRNLIQCNAEGVCFIEFRNNEITEDELCPSCVKYIKITKPMLEASQKGRVFKFMATHLINQVLKSE